MPAAAASALKPKPALSKKKPFPSNSKKRKVSTDASDDLLQQPSNKKKSPLFNLPQNRYAPPDFSTMTPDEISEWRKEQRRLRNRESAAASRNKNRAKLDELEGEANYWKSKYYEMECKMRIMEHQIVVLTKMCQQQSKNQDQASLLLPAQTVVSHPNSPTNDSNTISPSILPNTVTSSLAPPPLLPLFDNSSHHVVDVPNLLSPTSALLFSDPRNHSLVENPKVADATTLATTSSDAYAAEGIDSEEESWKHIIPISRPA